jgi:hypothetical protein
MTAEDDQSDPDQTPTAAALYIGTLSQELAQIARRHSLDSLAFILDMARMEAGQIATGAAADEPGYHPSSSAGARR